MKRKTPMRFDSECDRWYVELQGRNYGLHCGERVNIYIGGEPIPLLIGNGSTLVCHSEGCSFLFAPTGQVHGQHLR